MRRSSRKYAAPIEEPPINITPLIDVVFVILIMFIVVAPLLDIDNIELAGSNADQSPETAIQDNNPITIRVYPDNTIKFNDNKVFLPQLSTLLREAKKRHPETHPQVLHDKRARFGTYQDVKNAVESAGFDEMDIVLAPG